MAFMTDRSPVHSRRPRSPHPSRDSNLHAALVPESDQEYDPLLALDEQLDESIDAAWNDSDSPDIWYDDLQACITHTFLNACRDIANNRYQANLGNDFVFKMHKMHPTQGLDGYLGIDIDVILGNDAYETIPDHNTLDLWESGIEEVLEPYTHILGRYNLLYPRYIQSHCNITQVDELHYHIITTYGFILTPDEVCRFNCGYNIRSDGQVAR